MPETVSQRPGWALVNEVLAFVLEVIAIGALAWWGFSSGGVATRILLGIGAPAAAITLWWLFAAPKSRFSPPLAGVLVVKVLVFGSAALALYDLGQPLLAAVFAAIATLNTALLEFSRRTLPGHHR